MDFASRVAELTEIRIHKKSEVPVWRQITCTLAGQIRKKYIKPGDRTYSVRLLAEVNRISVTAIGKTFALLKEKGVLESENKWAFM